MLGPLNVLNLWRKLVWGCRFPSSKCNKFMWVWLAMTTIALFIGTFPMTNWRKNQCFRHLLTQCPVLRTFLRSSSLKRSHDQPGHYDLVNRWNVRIYYVDTLRGPYSRWLSQGYPLLHICRYDKKQLLLIMTWTGKWVFWVGIAHFHGVQWSV